MVGFQQLHVRDGTLRPDRPDQVPVKDAAFGTPWSQVEAGMAVMHGLPVFVVHDRGVCGGVFDLSVGEHRFYRACLDDDLQGRQFQETFFAWCADVRERSRRATAPGSQPA